MSRWIILIALVFAGAVLGDDSGDQKSGPTKYPVKISTHKTVGDGKGEHKHVPTKPKGQSLSQWCREDAKALCKDSHGESTFKCLEQHKSELKNDKCRDGINGYSVCRRDAQCGAEERVFKCVAKKEAKDLSAECTDSSFYRVIKFWRHRIAMRKKSGKGSSEHKSAGPPNNEGNTKP